MVEVVLLLCTLLEVLNVFSCFDIALELVNVVLNILGFVGNGEVNNAAIVSEVKCINAITHSSLIHYLILQTHN